MMTAVLPFMIAPEGLTNRPMGQTQTAFSNIAFMPSRRIRRLELSVGFFWQRFLKKTNNFFDRLSYFNRWLFRCLGKKHSESSVREGVAWPPATVCGLTRPE
jgi:hypothetical protein